jgi:hypothetical protein
LRSKKRQVYSSDFAAMGMVFLASGTHHDR